MNIAVIPARGGSKRIPRKNIKSFHGRPMIAWSIETALKSELFDRVWVSTDDPEIAEVAQREGAEIPFLRPARLSDDFSGTTEVVGHAVEWAQGQGFQVKAACCIYATAPFLDVEDLRRGYQTLLDKKCAFVFSATQYAASVYRAFKSASSGGVEMIFPQYYETRSQDLPPAFHDAAQFYWGRPEAWVANAEIFSAHSRLVEVPRFRVQDIDTPEDWHRAEVLKTILTSNK